MAIPAPYEVILPLLKHITSGEEFRARAVTDDLAREFLLTAEELGEKLKSGCSVFSNRVAWGKVHLKMAGLIESPRRGYIRITPEGQKFLSTHPGIDRSLPITKRIRSLYPSSPGTQADNNMERYLLDQTPAELIEAARDQQERTLMHDILERVRNISPAEFERLILALLEKMGYGLGEDSAQQLGGPCDGGVDGVIKQDVLGLDLVYIQAKRYRDKSSIGASDIQAFSGSLNMHRVQKGLFVTSSSFTERAKSAARKLTQNIILIDGEELARLMIKHNVGARVRNTYEFKAVDEDFFIEE